VADIGYQEFVKPLITKVCEDFEGSARGLDYGAGTGPVAAMLLEAAGYTMKLYDPFFHNHPEVLKETYNFAICCEVIEHFHQPLKEFRALHTYLLPGGVLYCMTDLIDNQREFEQWHYKNDPTHVVFYSEKTLLWIAREIGFSCCEITERVIKLAKS
jgi:SAM-dependent methyltransferase